MFAGGPDEFSILTSITYPDNAVSHMGYWFPKSLYQRIYYRFILLTETSCQSTFTVPYGRQFHVIPCHKVSCYILSHIFILPCRHCNNTPARLFAYICRVIVVVLVFCHDFSLNIFGNFSHFTLISLPLIWQPRPALPYEDYRGNISHRQQ